MRRLLAADSSDVASETLDTTGNILYRAHNCEFGNSEAMGREELGELMVHELSIVDIAYSLTITDRELVLSEMPNLGNLRASNVSSLMNSSGPISERLSLSPNPEE
jgi:hypothetical protein